MNFIIVLIFVLFILWLLLLNAAEKIGDLFIEYIVNPIKELFK